MAIVNVTDLTSLNSLLNELGLNQWQIQQGTYNGFVFTIAASPFSVNGLLNNLSGIGQAGTIVGYGEQLANAGALVVGNIPGLGGNTTNPITGIPAGANSGSMRIMDKFKKKVAINELPNGKDNIRSLGYNGNEIILIGIAWGTNYMTYMNNNLVQMFHSDETVAISSSANYHVLTHPIFGTINNCWLLEMRLIHESTRWRSCVFELRFRTEEPISGIANSGLNNILSQINNLISGILSAAEALVNIWGSLSNMINGNNQNQVAATNNIYVQNSLINSRLAVLDSVNNSVSVTSLLINNLAPNNYSNIALNNYVTTTPTLTQFNYFISNSTPNDIRNLNLYLTENLNNAISVIYSGVNPNDFYDSVDYLKGLISQIGQLSILLVNAYYGQIKVYKPPYDMSLFSICSENGLDYQSSYKKIIQLNQNTFFWLNQIPKGTPIILPNSNGQSI